MLVKSKSVNNGVQKRKEERDYDSVLIGEEIQLGFRVFFGLGFFFVNVLFFSSLLLLLSFTNQLQNPTISQVWNTFADLYTVRHGPNRVNIPSRPEKF